jgi:hypothetical protein
MIVAESVGEFKRQASALAKECRKRHPGAKADTFYRVVDGVIVSYDTNN